MTCRQFLAARDSTRVRKVSVLPQPPNRTRALLLKEVKLNCCLQLNKIQKLKVALRLMHVAPGVAYALPSHAYFKMLTNVASTAKNVSKNYLNFPNSPF